MFRIVHKAQDHVDNSELYINGFYCDVLQKKSSFLQIFFVEIHLLYGNRSQAYTILFFAFKVDVHNKQYIHHFVFYLSWFPQELFPLDLGTNIEKEWL